MNAEDEVMLDPQPIPPGHTLLYRAIGDLAASSYEGDDGISGTQDPRGPGGPVMRDLIAGIAIMRLGSALSDTSDRESTLDLGARITGAAARRLEG